MSKENTIKRFGVYVLEFKPDGRYTFLNRWYKPVGQAKTDEFVSHEPACAHIPRMSPSIARKLSCRQRENTQLIALYDDACKPWESKANLRAWLNRLELLFSLSTR